MMRKVTPWVLMLAAVVACGGQEQEEEPVLDIIAVGETAPDFELPGATRYGVLSEPVRLSDYRGETVVLGFFFRVRGRG